MPPLAVWVLDTDCVLEVVKDLVCPVGDTVLLVEGLPDSLWVTEALGVAEELPVGGGV